MIDRFLANLRRPRHGVVVLTAVVSLLMAAHWTPMMFPGLLVLVLTVVRPELSTHPATWWVMAALWFAAVVAQQDRMEDHVWLFTCWLVALAVSLSAAPEQFLDHAAWHARVLVGVTFSVAVLWKLFFQQFVNGMALWTFLVTDHRFSPLARGLGIPSSTLNDGQGQLTAVLAGTTDAYQPPSDLLWRVTVIAVLTLLLEATVAASFLSPDGSLLARLRLPEHRDVRAGHVLDGPGPRLRRAPGDARHGGLALAEGRRVGLPRAGRGRPRPRGDPESVTGGLG